MRRLHPSDSTERHLRAARYHRRRCLLYKTDPFFNGLATTIDTNSQNLLKKQREVEDTDLILTDLSADVDAAEIGIEDLMRDLKADTGKLDRKHIGLDATNKIFPDGLEGVIRPEGKNQLTTLTAFMTRLGDPAFASFQEIQDYIPQFTTLIADFKQKLDAYQVGVDKKDGLFVQEQNLRTAVREQLDDAHNKLRSRFKSKARLANRYFIPNARAGSSALARAEERGVLRGLLTAALGVLQARGLILDDAHRARLLRLKVQSAAERFLAFVATADSIEAVQAHLNAMPEESFFKEKSA